MSIVPPEYDTYSPIEEVATHERRRYKINSCISSVVEWALIILSAGLFIGFLGINFSMMVRQAVHSPAVAALLLFMALIMIAILRGGGK